MSGRGPSRVDRPRKATRRTQKGRGPRGPGLPRLMLRRKPASGGSPRQSPWSRGSARKKPPRSTSTPGRGPSTSSDRSTRTRPRRVPGSGSAAAACSFATTPSCCEHTGDAGGHQQQRRGFGRVRQPARIEAAPAWVTDAIVERHDSTANQTADRRRVTVEHGSRWRGRAGPAAIATPPPPRRCSARRRFRGNCRGRAVAPSIETLFPRAPPLADEPEPEQATPSRRRRCGMKSASDARRKCQPTSARFRFPRWPTAGLRAKTATYRCR